MIEQKELSKEDVARRAYELYVQRGGEPGNDVEDWLRAERELGAEPIVTPTRTKATQMAQSN
jgi:Protein of unknown function (DUF2934)